MPAASSPSRFAARFETFYPWLLLLACAFLWAGNILFARGVHELLPPVALSFGRWTISMLCLAPFAIPRLRDKLGILKERLGLFIVLGVLGVGIFHVMIYTGVQYTLAINAMLMNSSVPIFIIIVAWAFDGDRATPRQLAGMLLAFIGIGVIVTRGDLDQLLHLHFNTGDIAIVGGQIVWAFYSVLVRRAARLLDTLEVLFVINVIGWCVLAPAFFVESHFIRAPIWNAASLSAVLYTGFFASILGYVCWNKGVELVGPNKAGLTTPLQPVFGITLAILILGEHFEPYHAVAIVLVLLGVWFATSAPRKKPALVKAQ